MIEGKKSIGVICDFDGPLFDADALLQSIRDTITQGNTKNIEQFNTLYTQNKKDIPTLINALHEQFSLGRDALALFFESDIAPFLRSESREFIASMEEEIADFHIITKGDPLFQQSKLDRLSLKGTPLEEKNTFIVNEIQKMKKKGINRILIIDDKISELQKVFDTLPEEFRPFVQFIHMEVGRHGKEGTASDALLPYMKTITHLSEINPLLPQKEGNHMYREPGMVK